MSTISRRQGHGPTPLAEYWEPAHRHLFGAVVAECVHLRRGFANWPSLSAAIAVGRLRGQPQALRMRTRSGPTLQTPVGDRSWWTAVECFGRDCYRLAMLDLPPSPVVLDIGANIGAFTLAVVARWPQAQVTAIDASPAAVEALAANVARQAASNQVAVRHAAVVGAGNGTTALLHEHPDDLCTSSLLDHMTTGQVRQVEVPAIELSSVLSPHPATVDLLKIDVEGAEYEIVGTAPVELLTTVNRVLVEYHAVPGHDVAELAWQLAAAGLVWEWQEHSALPGQGLACWARPGGTR